MTTVHLPYNHSLSLPFLFYTNLKAKEHSKQEFMWLKALLLKLKANKNTTHIHTKPSKAAFRWHELYARGNLNFNQWPPPSGPRFVMWCIPTSVLVLCPLYNTKCPLYNTKEQHCNGKELSDTDASRQRHLYWKSVADTTVHGDSPLKNKQKQTDCPQIECQIKSLCMLQILLHPPHCFSSVWQLMDNTTEM